MSIELFHVDAFADEPFTGNPAGVCLLERAADSNWMQFVARDLNLPITAFLHPTDEGFGLRWFSPETEVDVCGHATLAAGHVLAQQGRLAPGRRVEFATGSGPLAVEMEVDRIVLEFPAAQYAPEDVPPELLAALGATPIAAWRFGEKRLIEVENEAALRAVAPDFATLRSFDERAIAITCRSESPDVDFVSRNFAPWIGIDEDAVTGSSHCCLGPYWSERLGKTTMHAVQASARGGRLRVEVTGDRVRIGGRAITVASGELRV